MNYRVACPYCDTGSIIDEDNIGKKLQCCKCNGVFKVDRPSSESELAAGSITGRASQSFPSRKKPPQRTVSSRRTIKLLALALCALVALGVAAFFFLSFLLPPRVRFSEREIRKTMLRYLEACKTNDEKTIGALSANSNYPIIDGYTILAIRQGVSEDDGGLSMKDRLAELRWYLPVESSARQPFYIDSRDTHAMTLRQQLQQMVKNLVTMFPDITERRNGDPSYFTRVMQRNLVELQRQKQEIETENRRQRAGGERKGLELSMSWLSLYEVVEEIGLAKLVNIEGYERFSALLKGRNLPARFDYKHSYIKEEHKPACSLLVDNIFAVQKRLTALKDDRNASRTPTGANELNELDKQINRLLGELKELLVAWHDVLLSDEGTVELAKHGFVRLDTLSGESAIHNALPVKRAYVKEEHVEEYRAIFANMQKEQEDTQDKLKNIEDKLNYGEQQIKQYIKLHDELQSGKAISWSQVMKRLHLDGVMFSNDFYISSLIDESGYDETQSAEKLFDFPLPDIYASMDRYSLCFAEVVCNLNRGTGINPTRRATFELGRLKFSTMGGKHYDSGWIILNME